MNALPATDALHRSVDDALARAIEAQDRVLLRATRLVELDDLGADTLTALTADAERRDAALRGLGAAVLAWVRGGGALELVEFEEPSVTPPQPADEAPDGPPVAEHTPRGAGELPPVPAAPPQPRALASPLEGPVQDAGGTRRAATPAAAPARATDVAALAARWETGRPAAPAPAPRPPSSPLERLGAMPDIDSDASREREISRLLTEASLREGWEALSPTAQCALVRHMAARARDLQARHGGSLSKAQRRDLDAVFTQLTHFQNTARPGFVHGLGRDHRPQRGSWAADAMEAWRELDAPSGACPEALLADVEQAIAGGEPGRVADAIDRAVRGGVGSRDPRLLTLAAPFRAALEEAGRCKTLRKALAGTGSPARDEGAEAGEEPRRAAPDVLALTEGRRALIVGGDRIGKRAGRLAEDLGLAKLDWHSGHKSRKIASVGKRIRAGTYDLVVFVRSFISHKVTDALVPATRERPGTLVAWCDRGCGLPALERAIRDAASDAPRAR